MMVPAMSDYVAVRDEPRHRHRFENDYARVYDVQLPPGDTTLFHAHTEDTLYVSIAAAHVNDQTYGEDSSNAVNVPAGIAICRPHRTEPLIHRVTNVGDENMRMIGIEAKQSPPQVSAQPLDVISHTVSWENDRIRIYRFSLEPGAAVRNLTYEFPCANPEVCGLLWQKTHTGCSS